MLYSRLAGRRLVVDWRNPPYSENGENAFPVLFAHPALTLTPEELRGRSIAPGIWKSWRREAGINRQIDRMRGFDRRAELSGLTADPARLDYPEEVAVYWSRFERIHEMRRHFQGEFQHLAANSDEQILRDLLRTEVAPHPDIAAQVGQFRRRHFTGEAVGVHVRHSDLSVSANRILRRSDKIVDRRPECKIFPATDNSDTLQQARQR